MHRPVHSSSATTSAGCSDATGSTVYSTSTTTSCMNEFLHPTGHSERNSADHLDLLVDGHPGSGQPLTGNASVTLAYPEGAATVELAGFSGGELRQRRRFLVGS
jgi:hypothetical protein